MAPVALSTVALRWPSVALGGLGISGGGPSGENGAVALRWPWCKATVKTIMFSVRATVLWKGVFAAILSIHVKGT